MRGAGGTEGAEGGGEGEGTGGCTEPSMMMCAVSKPSEIRSSSNI
jgi:hypothetical protein